MAQKPNPPSGVAGTLQKLVDVGLALSYEKDIDRVLELVLEAARDVSNSDAGTLYLKDGDHLHFKVVQNDTTGIRIGGTSGKSIPFPPVELIETNVSAYVALNGTPVIISDVYDTDLFDFTGPKKYDQSTGYRSKSMLVVPMLNHENEVIGVLQLLNAKDRQTGEVIAFRKESEGIVSSLASQAAVALTNKLLVAHLEENIADIKSLQTAEEELNKKLKDAFRDTDRKNTELGEALKKVRMVRYYAMIFIALLGIGGWLYSGGLQSLPYSITQYFSSADEEMMDMDMGMKSGMGSFMDSATVQRGPVQDSITMSGTLQPLKVVNIPSPLEGNVEKINFQYGGSVKKGQLLVEMNASKLETELRDAKTDFLQAAEDLKTLVEWENSLEVGKAKRAIDKALQGIDKAERDLANSKKLHELEIISANDLESAKQAVVSAKEAHQSSEEQLNTIREKGNELNLTIARNKQENALAKLTGLEKKLEGTVVHASLSGIVLDPRNTSRSAKVIDVGSETKVGAVLLTIGNLSGFSIDAKVDEVDVGKVKKGQTVLVTGDAFRGKVLKGKIAKLSSEASGSGGGFGSERATFSLVVAVKKIDPKVKKKLLVGMSANLEVITYKNDKALLLPVHAVQTMGRDTARVNRQNEGQTQPEQLEIKVGRTTLDSVEILKGLKEGDTVVY